MAMRSTTSENSNVRVYCRSATSSKRASMAEGGSAFSRAARAMTVTGDSSTNRSKTSLRIMTIASVGVEQLLGRRQFIKTFDYLHRAGLSLREAAVPPARQPRRRRDRRPPARRRPPAAAGHAVDAVLGRERHDALEPPADALLAGRGLSTGAADHLRRGVHAQHAGGRVPR